MEFTIKTPSLKGIKSTVSSALHSAGDAVLNAKTPSLKEVGEGANKAQKKLRHKLANLIDSKSEE